jgi:hypothetical protein
MVQITKNRVVMKRTRTISRLTVCWSVFNGTSCLCIECWSCKRKMRYHTLQIAKEKAKKARIRTQSIIKEYPCSFCGLFHIGHVGRR